MTKSKAPAKATNPSTSSGQLPEVKEEPKLPVVSSFSKFSGFSQQPNRLGGPKFNPKTFNARPTFVTQHKGGGGK